MAAIVRGLAFAGAGSSAMLVFVGSGLAFAIKAPLVPFHTCLPAAHVDAPAPASTILATVEMVAHGLITGALFLLSGMVWRRVETYEIAEFGGLAARAPKLTVFTALAAFVSLGLAGLAGFVAEFQIFAGAFGVFPWLAGIGLLGLIITAALLLLLGFSRSSSASSRSAGVAGASSRGVSLPPSARDDS